MFLVQKSLGSSPSGTTFKNLNLFIIRQLGFFYALMLVRLLVHLLNTSILETIKVHLYLYSLPFIQNSNIGDIEIFIFVYIKTYNNENLYSNNWVVNF